MHLPSNTRVSFQGYFFGWPVWFAAVGRKGGVTWLECPCTPNHPCLSPCSPSSCRSPAAARPLPWLWVGLCVWHLSARASLLPLCLCAQSWPALVSPCPWAPAALGSVHEGLGMLIPQGSRNIHSVVANPLCAIFLWNRSLVGVDILSPWQNDFARFLRLSLLHLCCCPLGAGRRELWDNVLSWIASKQQSNNLLVFDSTISAAP